MNKQQLASTIWQSANQMRSKIEANEYKDYILGFMFYKYLSDREISFLKGEKYSDEDIKKVTADDEKLVKHISENIGYFIAYEDLFSSWLSKGDCHLRKIKWHLLKKILSLRGVLWFLIKMALMENLL